MTTNDGHKTSILMVEDSPPQALKVKLALENNGCEVFWAETGQGGQFMP